MKERDFGGGEMDVSVGKVSSNPQDPCKARHICNLSASTVRWEAEKGESLDSH